MYTILEPNGVDTIVYHPKVDIAKEVKSKTCRLFLLRPISCMGIQVVGCIESVLKYLIYSLCLKGKIIII